MQNSALNLLGDREIGGMCESPSLQTCTEFRKTTTTKNDNEMGRSRERQKQKRKSETENQENKPTSELSSARK